MNISKIILTIFTLPMALFGFGNSSSSISRPSYNRVHPREAKAMIDSGENVVILDVRSGEEFRQGHIKNAKNLSYDLIPFKAADLITDQNVKIIVYCASGARSRAGANSLVSMGYTGVYDMGGIMSWPYEIVR